MPDKASTLGDWLAYVETVHPEAWDLTLDRVAELARRLDVCRAAPLVFLVAGTNGKGSTCTYIEALLRAAGLRTGLTTSPHFSRFNERFRINGTEASDADVITAFAAVEDARGDVTLTQFEYGALIALWLFREASLDACVLEIGLGGRFDAMNVADRDVSVITRIALDHTDWLGSDRETIGAEKAGIIVPGVPVVVADADPPVCISEIADELGAPLFGVGSSFGCEGEDAWWTESDRIRRITGLAPRALPDASFVAALQAVACSRRLPGVSEVLEVAGQTSMPGRYERRAGSPPLILDVAHNPDAAELLAERVDADGHSGPVHAVFNCYVDKDAPGVIAPLLPIVSRWFVPIIDDRRASKPDEIVEWLQRAGADAAQSFGDIRSALTAARSGAGVVLVFGSFSTLAAAYSVLD